MEATQQTEMYNILFNGITDAERLISQGQIEQAQALLIKAQQQTEELFINDEIEKSLNGNLALAIGATKEYICEKLKYNILTHDILDSEIRDSILDEELMNYVKLTHEGYDNKTREEIRAEFEDTPLYNAMYQLFNRTTYTYFQIGFDTHQVMTS